MERCTMTCTAGNYAQRCAGFMPGGCCEEPSYTVQNAYTDSYGEISRENVRENVRETAGNRCCPHRECDLSHAQQLPLTMAYVPFQEWCNTYDTQTALRCGSLFPELNKPFMGSRGERYVR